MRRALLFGAALVAACDFAVDGLPIASPGGIGSTPDGEAADFATVAAPDLAATDLATPSLPSNIGDPCSGQCGGGLTCANWLPAGYCTQSCSATMPCPSGSTCVDVGGGMFYCLVNYAGGCKRADLNCRDCGHDVCGPLSICGGC